MKSIFICLFIALGLVFSGNSQTIKGFAGFVKSGNTDVYNSEVLFTKIGPPGIKGYCDEFSLTGGEIYYRSGRTMLIFEGHIGTQNRPSFGSTYAEPWLGVAHAKAGWIISENANCWIYPSVGSGIGGLALRTYVRLDGKSENEQRQILLSPSFDLGINADILIAEVLPSKTRYGGLMVGMRGGYRASPMSSNWRNRDGNKLYNLPSFASNGFYVSAVVGGGWFWKK